MLLQIFQQCFISECVDFEVINNQDYQRHPTDGKDQKQDENVGARTLMSIISWPRPRRIEAAADHHCGGLTVP